MKKLRKKKIPPKKTDFRISISGTFPKAELQDSPFLQNQRMMAWLLLINILGDWKSQMYKVSIVSQSHRMLWKFGSISREYIILAFCSLWIQKDPIYSFIYDIKISNSYVPLLDLLQKYFQKLASRWYSW